MRKEIVKISQSFLIFCLLVGLAATGAVGASFDSEDQAFLDLINNYRVQNNIGKLSVDAKLEAGAIWMSDDMLKNCVLKDDCYHEDSTGRDYDARLRDFGYYEKASEIIAYGLGGISTAQQAFDLWKGSPGHNNIMLRSEYGAIGISHSCNSNGGCAWVADLGTKIVESYNPQPEYIMLPKPRCWESLYWYNPKCFIIKLPLQQ